MLKGKENILNTEREKKLTTHKETPVRVTSNFSSETMSDRKRWDAIFKVLKNL